jgi:hypothetical protein
MRLTGSQIVLPLLVIAALAACEPKRVPQLGVHVADAGDDSARAEFTIAVEGSMVLGIRSSVLAMQPDKSLILSTPADVLVNSGTGSAVITVKPGGPALRVTNLDPGDTAGTAVVARRVRLTHHGPARHVTVAPVTPPTP